MTMRKKIILWGLGSFFALLLAFVLLVPTLIDSSALKRKIQTTVSRKNIGELDYNNANLSILPLPHLTIRQISLTVPERAVAKIETLKVYPELLPLLGGQLRFSKIYLYEPEFKAILPEEPPEKVVPEKNHTSINVADSLAAIIAPLATYTSNLELTIVQGGFDLAGRGRQRVIIRDLDLHADLNLIGPRSFEAKLNVTKPALTVNRTGKKVTIDCDKIEASLRMDDDKVIFYLADLTLAQPALKLSGQLLADPNRSGFSLDLTGQDLDVEAIRTAALDLGGDDETIKDIFSYLKGGRIPNISVQSKSKNLVELGDLDNIIIQGRMQNGDISIDDIGMQLAEVNGDVLISKGRLDASGASARLGETTGHDGALKIGLVDDEDTFHLDIMLNAQLDQVPAVLKKIIDHDEAFIQELSLIKNLKGTAKARLVLGESLDEINTKVEVSEMDFSADYQRVPFPIKISRGKLLFTENMVSTEGLDGRVGNSSFSNISSNIQWQKGIIIDIPSGSLTMDLGELYPWVSSFDVLKAVMADLKGVKGSLDFSALKLKSPHDKSDQWQLTGSGEVREVAIDTTLLPEVLHLSSGKIQLKPNQFSFQKLKTRLLDADLDLSGTLSGSFQHPDRGDVTVNGELGEKATLFMHQHLHLPTAYAVHAPLQFDKTHITWQYAAGFSFKGDVFFPKGARIFSDFQYRPGDLTINHLDIQDQDSQATSTFELKKNSVNFKFNGHLNKKTLDRIFVAERLSGGWLKGNLQVALVRGKLSESTLQGQLEGGNLLVPLTEGEPVVIEKFALTAQNNRIVVNHFLLVQKENLVDLKGQVNLTADGFVLDLDASAGALKWIASEKPPKKVSNAQQDESNFFSWHYPVAGAIHLVAKSFTWEDYTWKPFHAEISRIKDGVNVEVSGSQLCGIDSAGTLQVTGNELALDFQLTAKDQDITHRYACLTKDRIHMTGLFDLTAQIKARGLPEDLFRSVQGHFDFTARKGQITQDKKLSRLLEVVNFTEIVKGKIPDLKSEGFNYETITVQGEIAKGMVVFKKLYMDGKTLDLVGQGKLDLDRKTLDIELLAAPFKTVDSAIKYIPGVNYLMVGNLVSIPVSVKGVVSDPKVSIMSASAVRSSLLDFAERFIKSPVKLIESVIPGKKNE